MTLIMRARLRRLAVWLLLLALPLQALAAVMPSWLPAHDHHAIAATAATHSPALHPPGVDHALARTPVAPPDTAEFTSPLFPSSADACSCAWCIACPIPVSPPPPPANPGSDRPAPTVPYLPRYIADLPQPPPRG